MLSLKQALDGADKDLGTSGIALLDPTVFKTPTVGRIGCIAGKSGKLYFLNLEFVVSHHFFILFFWFPVLMAP